MDLFFQQSLPLFYFSALSLHVSFILLHVLASLLKVWNNHPTMTTQSLKTLFFFSFYPLLQCCDFYTPIPLCVAQISGTDLFYFQAKRKEKSHTAGWYYSIPFMPLQCQCWGLRTKSVLLFCLDITKRKKISHIKGSLYRYIYFEVLFYIVFI